MPASKRDDDARVHSISTAMPSVRHDRDHRVRVYLLSMGIRTAAFVLAFICGFVIDLVWAAWVFMVLAVVLPYPAVVIANNRDRHTTAPRVTSPTYALSDRPATSPKEASAPDTEPVVIVVPRQLQSSNPRDEGPALPERDAQ